MNTTPSTVSGWFIAFVAATGSLLSVGASWWVAGEEGRERQLRLRQLVTAYATTLGHRIHELDEIVGFTERLFVASDEVTPEEFRAFTGPMLVRHPEIRAVQWMPRVSGAERESFESAIRRGGIEGFRIVERGEGGAIVPAGSRERYFPVLYVESPEVDGQVIGFDLASAPSSGRLLEIAAESGEAVVSGRIVLAQEPRPHFGLLVVQPILRENGAAVTTEGRRHLLRGMVACTVGFERLLATVVSEEEVRGLALSLVDDFGETIYSRISSPASTRGTGVASAVVPGSDEGVSAPVAVAGKQWSLRLTPIGGGTSVRGFSRVAGGVALAGLLLTTMLAAYLQRIRREGQRHLLGAQALAREAEERKEAEQELRLAYVSLAHVSDEVQQRRDALRSIIDALPYPLYVIDAESYRVKTANTSAEELGLQDGAVCYRALWGFDHPCDRQHPGRQCPIARVREEGETCVVGDSYDVTGGARSVDFHSTPKYDTEGALREVIISAIDVTEKRRAREQTAYLSFQAGVAEMGATLLHNIGNAVMSIAHRAATLEGKSRELSGIGAILSGVRAHLARGIEAGEPAERATEAALALIERVGRDLEKMAEEVFLDDAKVIRTGVEHIAESIRIHQDTARPRQLNSQFRVGELIADAAVIQSDTLEKYGVNLEVLVEEGLGVVELPRSQLLQVLINLIRNAQEAVTASGRREGRVTVHARRIDDRRFELVVADDGVGIDATDMDQLFTYGFTTKSRGSGFGLHSASTFIQSIGGEIRVASEGPGRGAEFTVVLPLKYAKDGIEQ